MESDIMKIISKSDKVIIAQLDDKIRLLEQRLKSNLEYQQVLNIALKRVDIASERNTELKKILDSVIDKDKVRKRKKDSLVFKKAGVSYFLDKGKSPPLNFDALMKKQIRNENKVPESLEQKKWVKKDVDLLAVGVRQQSQQLLLAELYGVFEGEDMDLFTEAVAEIEKMSEVELENHVGADSYESIDWGKISETCFGGKRSADDCKVHWFSHRQNNANWTKEQDIKLLKVAGPYGNRNWVAISNDLKMNYLPHQCFARYQRSLNSGLIKSTWSEEEDRLLREAVKRFGDKNWQQVASCLDQRTGQQCMHRWTKSVSPTIVRGRWGADEDRRLTLSVTAYENDKKPRWALIKNHIDGRTDVQCRERWKNILDPVLSSTPWTKEEDKKLLQAAEKYGYGKWAKIAKDVYPRTDNQCCRRWKQLNTDKLPEYHHGLAVKRHHINNFVGRECEKSELTAEEFPLNVAELLEEESKSKLLRNQRKLEQTKLVLRKENLNIPSVTQSINPNPNSVFSTSLPLTDDDIASLRTHSKKGTNVAAIETEYVSLPLVIPSQASIMSLVNLLKALDTSHNVEEKEHESNRHTIVDDPHFKLLSTWMTSLYLVPSALLVEQSLANFPRDVKSTKKRDRELPPPSTTTTRRKKQRTN